MPAENPRRPQTWPRPKPRNRLPRSSSRSSTRCSSAPERRWPIIETYDQARVDRLCQAVAWAVANKQTFTRLVDMGIAESGLGDAGEPDGQADEDPRRAARRAAAEERRHHRGAARKGHRQVRQAGGDRRLHRPDHQSGPDAGRQRDLRHQGARRRDLLAAPALEEDVVRDRPADARGARARRRARRHPAVPDQGQHPDVAGADGARRPDRRHRRPADGARRVQLRHAGLRRGRRQLDDDHRRDGQHRGSGAQHAAVEDLRLRLGLLGRRQPHHRGVDLRQAAEAAAGRRRLPRERRGEGRAAARRCGTTRRHRTADTVAIAPQQLAKAAGFTIPADRKFIIVHGDGIGKEHRVLRRKADHAARRLQVPGLRPGARP